VLGPVEAGFEQLALLAMAKDDDALFFDILAEAHRNPDVGHTIATLCLQYRGILRDLAQAAHPGLSETDLGVFGGKGQNMLVVVPFVATSSMPSVKAFVTKVKAQAGGSTGDLAVSNYVMTHYNALMAVKAAIEKAGKVDKEAVIDALEGLTIQSPTGRLTMGKNHHATMNMFLAKTKGRDLVTVRALGAIAPDPGCR